MSIIQKLYKKTTFFKWLTAIGIFSVLALQVVSTISIYNNMSKLIEKDIKDVFVQSMKEYRDLEIQINKKDDLDFTIKSFKDEDEARKVVSEMGLIDYSNKLTIDDIMNKIISIVITQTDIPINTKTIDSIFHKNLVKQGLEVPFGLTIYRAETDSILFQSDNFAQQDFQIHTPKTDFDINTEVRASFKDVYKVVLDNIFMYMFFSAIIMIIVSISLFFQLHLILMQKKIEQIRQDFVDSMTHELKQPVQGALSLTEILANPNFSNNEKQRVDAINRIKNNLQQIKISIESILEKSYSNDIEYIPNLKFEDITKIINTICSNMYLTHSNKNMQINTYFSNIKTKYAIDPLHFPNAIKNLVENSIKYSKPNEKLQIDINVLEEDNYLKIKVKDNGIGIKPENLDLIFNKFYRVEQKGFGFGLGLNYVKWVCKSHNGSISVDSKYKIGSTFTIQIPCIS